MTTTNILIGMLIGYLIIAIPKSIYIPGTRKIKAIMFFGKLWTIIANVEGKDIYKGITIPGQVEKWDLIDSTIERTNIYFFLWPFFKVYKYPLTYIKIKRKGEEQEGDVTIWQDEKSSEIWISRTGTSDHLEFREDYPTISAKLSSSELANVITYTNNMIEIVNAKRALFGIKNWYIATMEILSGAQRGLVADMPLFDLNQFSSEDKEETFSQKMKDSVNRYENDHPGLGNFGVRLFKSVFKDFEPADEKAKQLMDSYAQVTIAEETGKAEVKKAEKDKEAKIKRAEGEKQAKIEIAEGEKQALLKKGLAKADTEGNIIELIPDANVKAGTDALSKLSELKGTLVIDGSGINKIFTINPTKTEE